MTEKKRREKPPFLLRLHAGRRAISFMIYKDLEAHFGIRVVTYAAGSRNK